MVTLTIKLGTVKRTKIRPIVRIAGSTDNKQQFNYNLGFQA